MAKNKRPKFEECISLIDAEIIKRRGKWNLTALGWMDFDDVSQILRIHIYKKWDLYDPAKPLAPWLNRIISNQLKNLIRNNYGNYARPCLKCAAAEGDNLCIIYEKQDNSCPLFAQWEKTKKIAHDIKIPVSLENHTQEISNLPEDKVDIEKSIKKLNKNVKYFLKPVEYKVYNLLYIKHMTEEEVAKKMGYKTSEKGRSPGYKQIKNIKKAIIIKIKKKLEDDELDLF